MRKTKVFGIGLSRTGTSSLTFALRMLGFTAGHFPDDPIQLANEYDALTDITVARDYKKLDKLFPGSKFVLTIRDMDSWLKSVKSHFLRNPAETREKWVLDVRKAIYDTEKYDQNLMKNAYLRHLEDVKNYFKDRKNDLLIMNICEGEGWEILCPFLSLEIPSEEFPRVNTTESNTRD